MLKAIRNWFSSEDPEAKLEIADFEPSEVAETLTALRKDFDELKATHAGQLAAKEEKLTEAKAKVAELTNAAKETSEELINLKATHAEEIKAERESVAAKVEAELASLSVDPVPVLKEEKRDIVAEYRAIPAGPEREKFRNENKAALEAAGALNTVRFQG